MLTSALLLFLFIIPFLKGTLFLFFFTICSFLLPVIGN